MRIAMGVYLFIHGFCHLVGFVVPWKILTMKEEPYRTTLVAGAVDVGDVGIRIVGLFWLFTALAFLSCSVAALAHWPWWRPLTIALAVWSLLLCLLGLPGAKIGILANALVLGYLWAARLGWAPAL